MPYMPSRTRAVVLATVLLAGCRLPGRDGPVPQTLENCRRLSQRGVTALERGDQPQAETLLAQAVKTCPVDAERGVTTPKRFGAVAPVKRPLHKWKKPAG